MLQNSFEDKHHMQKKSRVSIKLSQTLGSWGQDGPLREEKPAGTILVFLPGWGDIVRAPGPEGPRAQLRPKSFRNPGAISYIISSIHILIILTYPHYPIFGDCVSELGMIDDHSP